ncbi:unnamed protein product [Paramecium octaurelia]|uniref:Uncharacterized protein n=1 Tax=Paramecium octaurelia TaxID=43137 RepID=A0A8S1T2Z8_PAROT|nr:unnamed protein product [Paramecium octaurelia]CAD8145354.1 unnamed protein product [Paramecium octaurelia]
MTYQFCQIKDQDDQTRMYICNSLECIDLKDNELLCQKCLCKHKGLHYNKLKDLAMNQYYEYMQI